MDSKGGAQGGGGGGGGGGGSTTSSPKFQNHAKLNPIVKTVKNCWIYDANTLRCSEKRQ